MGDSEEETEEKKAELEKLGPFPLHPVRESPTIIIPERDKALWEKLAKRSGLKHRVIESDQLPSTCFCCPRQIILKIISTLYSGDRSSILHVNGTSRHLCRLNK